jgi:hypothetical protein
LNFSKSVAEPGQSVDLKIKSSPNSFVSICVIDQSIELLRTPNYLTNDLVSNHMNEMRLNAYYPPTHSINFEQKRVPGSIGENLPNDMMFPPYSVYVKKPNALVKLHVRDFFNF